MNFIGNWIKKWYISSATGRAIELGLLSATVSFLMGMYDNIDLMISGGTVDRELFLSTFASTTALTIIAWYRKKTSDLLKEESGLI